MMSYDLGREPAMVVYPQGVRTCLPTMTLQELTQELDARGMRWTFCPDCAGAHVESLVPLGEILGGCPELLQGLPRQGASTRPSNTIAEVLGGILAGGATSLAVSPRILSPAYSSSVRPHEGRMRAQPLEEDIEEHPQAKYYLAASPAEAMQAFLASRKRLQ